MTGPLGRLPRVEPVFRRLTFTADCCGAILVGMPMVSSLGRCMACGAVSVEAWNERILNALLDGLPELPWHPMPDVTVDPIVWRGIYGVSG